jgi:ribosomal protein S17E
MILHDFTYNENYMTITILDANHRPVLYLKLNSFDLNVPLVKEVIKQRSTRYHNKIEGHVNVLIQPLLQPQNGRRLKRNWPADLREG